MDERITFEDFAVVRNNHEKQQAIAAAMSIGLTWASSSRIPDGAGGFIRGHYRMRFVRWKTRRRF